MGKTHHDQLDLKAQLNDAICHVTIGAMYCHYNGETVARFSKIETSH